MRLKVLLCDALADRHTPLPKAKASSVSRTASREALGKTKKVRPKVKADIIPQRTGRKVERVKSTKCLH
jgi:hypothetical protein